MFLAITREAADWVLGKPQLQTALLELLLNEATLRALREGDLVEGPARVSGDADGKIIAFWNVDYLSGTGDEHWAFLKVTGGLGLADEPEVARKVFTTELATIAARLSGLRLDTTYIHRMHENGAHTIRADRGEMARRMNLGYVEGAVAVDSGQVNSLLLVGPAFDLVDLGDRAVADGKQLPKYVAIANSLSMPNRRRPVLDLVISSQVRLALDIHPSGPRHLEHFQDSEIATARPVEAREAFTTAGWSYDDWMNHLSQLSIEQRYLLESDPLSKHPVRIVGPAGSGKSLIMQLLAAKKLRDSVAQAPPVRILYIVHNSAMEISVRDRFGVLGITCSAIEDNQGLVVSTLSEYARTYLKLETDTIIDVDAYDTKLFQYQEVIQAFKKALLANPGMASVPDDEETDIFRQVMSNDELLPLFARLLAAEISTAIKGHGLVRDRQRYVYSARSLSRLHNIMGRRDRDFVFSVFEIYQHAVFEEYGVLDADDVALSLVGQLDTPVWELRRKDRGYDYVFVDETQLFNENERRVLPLLTRGTTQLAPIALALDEAQEFFGQTSAGLAALGIEGIEDERLPSNHRSTAEIVRLSFFVIEKTTDLFGPDFPKFSRGHVTVPSNDQKASPPRIEFCAAETKNIGRFVAKRVNDLRSRNITRIAVICHSEAYFEVLRSEMEQRLGGDRERFHVLLQRGELLPGGGPICVLSRPAYVGGQEFEAVIVVGLEQGLVPPRVTNNGPLEGAVFQQSLREMYLSFSRAQFQLILIMNTDSTPTSVIQQAVDEGLLSFGGRSLKEP